MTYTSQQAASALGITTQAIHKRRDGSGMLPPELDSRKPLLFEGAPTPTGKFGVL
jgi:hypothetical protein